MSFGPACPCRRCLAEAVRAVQAPAPTMRIVVTASSRRVRIAPPCHPTISRLEASYGLHVIAGQSEAHNHPQRRREREVVNDRLGTFDGWTEDNHVRRQTRMHQDAG